MNHPASPDAGSPRAGSPVSPAALPSPTANAAPSAVPPCPGVRIALFAGMAEAAGRRRLDIAWDGGSAAALRRRLADELPHLAPLLARSAVAIGDAYVTDDTPIHAGSDVAIIPPVSGG